MEKITRTLSLAGASFSVLRKELKLLVLPALAGLTGAAIFWFILRIWIDWFDRLGPSTPIAMMLFAVLGLALPLAAAMKCIGTFFNTALIAAADESLRGGYPKIGTALMTAASKSWRVIPWALTASFSDLFLGTIRENTGGLSRFGAMTAGLAWSLASYLVLPVIIFEDAPLGRAIERSRQLFLRTWGMHVSAQIGFATLGAIFALPGFLLMITNTEQHVAADGSLEAVLPSGSAGWFGVAWIVAIIALHTALEAILKTALYHLAANGVPPEGFDEYQLRASFS